MWRFPILLALGAITPASCSEPSRSEVKWLSRRQEAPQSDEGHPEGGCTCAESEWREIMLCHADIAAVCLY